MAMWWCVKKGDDLQLTLIDGLGDWSMVPFEQLLPYPVAVFRLKGKIRRFFRLLQTAQAGQPSRQRLESKWNGSRPLASFTGSGILERNMSEHVLRSEEPLQLLPRQPFGQGGKRDCFVHPHHPDRCVKVARAGCEPETLLRQSPLWRSWRKSVQDFDENYSDWRTLDALEKSDDVALWNHVPHCFGWVDTDRGRGLTVDLIRDADGLISRSFIEYLWTHGYDEAARNGVDQLSRFWEMRAIPSRSLGLHNLAAQLSPDGTLRLVLIDGFGSTEFIPWSKWSKSHAIARSRRKIEAMKSQIAVKLAQKSRGEGPGKYGFLLSRSLPNFIVTLTQGMETPNLVAGLTSFC